MSRGPGNVAVPSEGAGKASGIRKQAFQVSVHALQFVNAVPYREPLRIPAGCSRETSEAVPE
jgi:hypothetical protein